MMGLKLILVDNDSSFQACTHHIPSTVYVILVANGNSDAVPIAVAFVFYVEKFEIEADELKKYILVSQRSTGSVRVYGLLSARHQAIARTKWLFLNDVF